MSEKDIQKKILNCLRQEGIYAIKVVLAGKNGVPDVIACINGQFVAFEVKNGTRGVVTQLQEYNLEQIRKSMGLAFIVRSFDEFLSIYNTITK